MTTVEITLPDALAKEAAQAGLLANDALAELLRARLADAQRERFLSARAKLRADAVPELSASEIREEIEASRAAARG